MGTRKNRRFSLLAIVLLLAVFATACSASSDPETWAEALESGSVSDNFLAACAEADDGATSDTASLDAYCGCSFDELQQAFADDFGRFKAVDDALRNDPELINNASSVEDDQLQADINQARALIDACASEHL
ncbi:MAG: hypothetical protein ACI9C1_000053 [Candidatus Aldehydirespiratoraceae bacterium]|jgi:hypothetical protein